MAFGKDLRLAPWSFMSHFPPDPRFYGSVERVPRQLRPARKPHERCPCLLTAVLLNKPDRQLLQGTMRLGGASYTVGSARSAHNVRPYEQNEPPRVPAGGHMGPPYKRIENLTRGRVGLTPPVRGRWRAKRARGGRDHPSMRHRPLQNGLPNS